MATYREFHERTRQRRRRQGAARFGVFLLLILLILGVAYLVVKVAAIVYPQGAKQQDFVPQSSVDGVLEALGEESETQQDATEVTEKLPEGPHKEDINATKLTNPDFRMISLPENGRVDMSYFDNATFLGDSLTQGIAVYNDNTFPNSDLAAWKGVSPMTLLQNQMAMDDGTTVNALDYVVTTDPGKVYVLLGSNALSWQEDDLILKYYEQLLDELCARLPGALIYVQSIPTVTAQEEAARTAKGQDFTQARINGLNDQLAKMVYVRGLYFIDLQEALCGDDGYLNPAYDGGDGVHLNAEGYRAWRDYLLTHTAHRWDNPYLLGSPYYDTASNDAWLNASDSAAESTAQQSEEPQADPSGQSDAAG